LNVIGIRHENKSKWEGRIPLVPSDVDALIKEHSLKFRVESSPIRAFAAEALANAGAVVTDDISDCPVIIGLKEIPPDKLLPNKTYVYFSHTIKGQPENMPALRRLMELNCQLIDYERIVDDKNRRLVFFGPFAGFAGMIDTLWAFGRRLTHEKIDSPFSLIKPAHDYDSLDQAKRGIAEVGELIKRDGLPESLTPLVCGFAGYGQVSRGAQEVYDVLPVKEVSPDDLPSIAPDPKACYKVVFREEHLATQAGSSAPFKLQEYYDHPDRYQPDFFRHAPYLSMLVNCIYWEPKYPKLLTREEFRRLHEQEAGTRLRVVGDITCDIDGSLECTTHTTTPDSPVYVYDPVTGQTHDGVTGEGPVVLAVDFLPCELPVDASNFFSKALKPLIPVLAGADFKAELPDSGLSPEWQRATIVYHGKLTEPYEYLKEHL